MKKTNCIHAKTCSSNCGICSIYQSSAPKNREELIMVFVNQYNESMSKGNTHSAEATIAEAKYILTEKEYRVFEFEINGKGI